MHFPSFLLCLSVVTVVWGFKSTPVVMFSYSLVPGITSRIATPKPAPFNLEEVSLLADALVSQCSSGVYVLVNHPGLTLQDFGSDLNWPGLRQAMAYASTLATFPHVRGLVDLAALERLITEQCHSETIVYNGDSWTEFKQHEFITSRKRVVRLNFPPLPVNPAKRSEALQVRDNTLGMMLKRMPTPFHTVIYTSDTLREVQPMPEAYQEAHPHMYEIFADISLHPSRRHEVERNDRFKKVAPDWNEPRHKVLLPSDDTPSFWDPEAFLENEVVILAAAFSGMVVLGVFAVKAVGCAWRGLTLKPKVE